MQKYGHHIRVCVVEDNHFLRHAFGQMVSNGVGYDLVASYDSGEAAIANIPTILPDVVLMDIDMGLISGIEAVRVLKQKCPQVQFIMCTVHDEDEKIFQALSAGASGYLLKSTQPDDILLAIKELYNGGAPMSSQIASKVVASFRVKSQVNNEVTEKLSSREGEILEELVNGLLYKEIAVKLGISQETVRKHVYNIYKKLQVNNRVEAFNKYYGNSGKGG